MFEGLRHRAVVGSYHQQRKVSRGDAGQQVAQVALVPGQVDEVGDDAAAEISVRVAGLDRHAAPPLLGQAVGAHAGEGEDEARLAVVDVAGGGDDHRAKLRQRSAFICGTCSSTSRSRRHSSLSSAGVNAASSRWWRRFAESRSLR